MEQNSKILYWINTAESDLFKFGEFQWIKSQIV